MKIFIFKLLISIFVIFTFICEVQASTYVSLSPVFTEIIYALNAQDNLLGVSSVCDYPKEAKTKPIIGDTYFVNSEMIVKLKPDYLFALDSAKPKLGELFFTNTKPVYFDFKNTEDIYSAIRKIAKLTDKNPNNLIKDIKEKIKENKAETPKHILYVVQTKPLITIGKESFITDIIKQSGNISVTSDINYYYPEVNVEYLMKKNPDIIIICFPSDTSQIKKLFPNTKIVYLNNYQRDIIMRPGPRIYEAVKLFGSLNFNENPD